MKKAFSLVLCLILVLSLAVPAFAAEDHNHTITINNANDGYVYAAYQIFKGDLGADGVLSNVQWGTGVNSAALLAELKTNSAFAACTDAASVAAVIANCDAMDDPKAIAFAEVVRKHVTTTFVTSADKDTYYTISPLTDGYYLVVNTAVPDEENTTYSRYIMEVVRDITVAHKGTFPTVDKKIIEAELEVETNEAAIGEDVVYKITGTIPTNIADYSTYYYAFHDTLSKGLTYNNDMSITVNGVDVTDYFYVEAGAYDEVNGTEIFVGIQNLLALENLVAPAPVVGDITHATKVILTYSAEVNTNAVIAVAGNPNKVKLEYDNNPNDDGAGETLPPPPDPEKPTPPDPTGVTPEKTVNTYTTRLRIFKKDGAGKALTGAEFTLTGEAVKTTIITRETFAPAAAGEIAIYYELNNGQFTKDAPVTDDPSTTDVNEDTTHAYKSLVPTHVIKEVTEVQTKTESVNVKSFVGEDGYVIFNGLGAGEYTLTESVTPDGFNTIQPITFTIEFDPVTKKFFCEDSSWILQGSGDFVNGLYAEIINVAGTTLPSTGGMGTTIFYILGGLMVTGAAVLLITKKRMTM